jgi:cytochrome bd-type quinol oxidase subunit 2
METLALAVWVGGLVSIVAAVIPAVFSTIGMETGGRMLTRMFQGYDRLALVSAGLIVAGTLVRLYGHTGNWREQIGMSELVLLTTMVAVATVLTCWLTPETARLQGIAFGAKDDAKHIAYDNFFTYHRVARALYIINLGLGITLLCVKVKKWVR